MSRQGIYDPKYGFIPDEDCPEILPKPQTNADRVRSMTEWRSADMEITLKVEDYLSPEEIRDMCEGELRAAIRKQLWNESDIDRILSNRSYEYIFNLAQEQLGIHADKFKAILAERVEKLLSDESTLKFVVFRRADAWKRTESVACKYLDEVLNDCKPKIEEMVNKIIENYPFDELRSNIADTIYECIMLTLRKEPS